LSDWQHVFIIHDPFAAISLSPLATLDRGYAIVRQLPGGEILRRADAVHIGDVVEVLLSRGRLYCRITATEPANGAPAVDRDQAP